MSTANLPIQALSDALSTLESRVSSLEGSVNAIPMRLKLRTRLRAGSASVQQPLQLLQQRIQNLGKRIYVLECSSAENDAADEDDDTTSTPQPLQYLRSAIADLVTRVNELDDGSSGGGGSSSDDDIPANSTLTVKYTTADGKISVSASNPPPQQYYRLFIRYTLDGNERAEFTEITQCSSTENNIWTKPAGTLSGDIKIIVSIHRDTDRSGNSYSYTIDNFTSSSDKSITITASEWGVYTVDQNAMHVYWSAKGCETRYDWSVTATDNNVRVYHKIPEYLYYRVRIYSNVNSIDTTTDWAVLPQNAAESVAWSTDVTLNSDVTITTYVSNSSDGSDTVYYNTQTTSVYSQHELYIYPADWTEYTGDGGDGGDGGDDTPTETRTAQTVYTWDPSSFESNFQAQEEDEDDSNDRIVLTEYTDGTASLYINVHQWRNGEGLIPNTILSGDRLRVNGSGALSYKIGGSGAYKVYLSNQESADALDWDGLTVQYNNNKCAYDGVNISIYNSSLDVSVSQLSINADQVQSYTTE